MCNELTALCSTDPNGNYYVCKQSVTEIINTYSPVCGPRVDQARDESCHNYFVWVLEEYFFSYFTTVKASIIAKQSFSLAIIPLVPSYPVTWCDSNTMSHEVNYVPCSSDLEYCQQVAYTCMASTGDDAQTCANNWAQHAMTTLSAYSMYPHSDPYRDHFIYEEMKQNGEALFGFTYAQFISMYETTCPAPEGPPPDPFLYCDDSQFSEMFFGTESKKFCRFFGAKCAGDNDQAHLECKNKWANFYFNYEANCPYGSFIHSQSDSPQCDCEKIMLTQLGPSIYGNGFDSWIHEYFHTQSTVDSACPCETLESGMISPDLVMSHSLAQVKTSFANSNKICKK